MSNLVGTYASAAQYGANLSSNPDPLRPLPGFAADDARTAHKTAVVAIGFEPLGLNQLYQDQIERVRYIFPFPPGPPGPPGFSRNWGFVRKLERSIVNREAGEDDRWHIDMYDCPTIFDALCRETNNGTETSVLAPYGPKTTSLAMCLLAIAADKAGCPQVPIYFAQPKRYDIDYSKGLRFRGGQPDIQSYCIRLDGRDLYQLAGARVPFPGASSTR